MFGAAQTFLPALLSMLSFCGQVPAGRGSGCRNKGGTRRVFKGVGVASFVLEHMDEIVAEWESFARNLSPETAKMDSWALRDHAKPMLEAIAKDIETSQTDRQQSRKSKGLGP